MINKKKYWILLSFFITVSLLVSLIYYRKLSWFIYPVKGVDVSAHQGIINWSELKKEGIDFAFIKATEGSSFYDKRFLYNWNNAGKTKLFRGAYHFFSFDSSGKTQAENFINIVPRTKHMLPPVVDIEFYAGKEKNPHPKEEVMIILSDLLYKLEKYYDKKPILYVTKESYDMYIKGEYEGYPIWIRSLFLKPALPDKKTWTFWQYSNRGKLKGYSGKEKYIDLNVFNGTIEELQHFTQ